MYNIPQASSVAQVAVQTDFIRHFGSFLTYEADVGLMAYDMAEDGEILYAPVEQRPIPLQRIVNIDGSPRQERVRGIELPELKDIKRGDEGKETPFHANVYMLQKAIEVPLGVLMKGWSDGSDRGVFSVPDAAAFKKRIEQVGDMSARQFLAKYNGLGIEEKRGIIEPIARDIHVAAERLSERDGGTTPYGCLYNSAVLFAALSDSASHERAANNFFAAARWLYVRESFVAAAVLSELAAEVSRRKENAELAPDEEDRTPGLERLNEFYSLAADGWHKSVETDLTPETYAFRLYRGMRASWSMPDKSRVDRFLRLASHLSIASVDFDKAAADFMRRAWYGAQRYSMDRKDWAFVRDMINRAVSMWIPSEKVVPANVEKAVRFAEVAKHLDVAATMGPGRQG